jgi:Gpi18-like mannosyltransferase
VIALAVISFGVLIAKYNNQVVPINSATSAHYTLEPSNFLSYMSNWDGPDYLRIAVHGYGSISQTNFFPLYPLLIHVVNQVISSALNSALLIAWLCFAASIYFYLKLIKVLFNQSENIKVLPGLALFILFPTAMFMLGTYTESLFAALALAALYFTFKRKYLYAAIAAALATSAHVTGLLLIVLVGLIMLEQKAKLRQIFATCLAGVCGLVAYMAFLQVKFNRPFSFIGAQKNHGWLHYGFSNLANTIGAFNILFIGLLILAAIYWWRRRRSFSVYSLLFLVIPLAGREFGGFNRYCLMAFPIPLMLYAITRKRPNLYTLILVISTISWTYFLLQYAGGYVGG